MDSVLKGEERIDILYFMPQANQEILFYNASSSTMRKTCRFAMDVY